MRAIGLDIGTTNLSAVVLELPSGHQLASRTAASVGFLPTAEPWEKLQDAEEIVCRARKIIEELKTEFGPIDAIGIDGQMHGILYINAAGKAVSPLYTWQDGRGNLPEENGKSFVQNLAENTGLPMATGYGLVTHAWNIRHNNVPCDAVSVATIDTYLSMRLTGNVKPVLHVSQAASLGAFCVEKGCFDEKALRIMEIDPVLLPDVTAETVFVGSTPEGIPVTVGLGDNQASFLGSVPEPEKYLLVNMGTGGQISALAQKPAVCEDIEVRPFLDGSYLLVGCPLCSGRAYAILEKFIRECAVLAGAQPENMYKQLNRLAASSCRNPLKISTLFCGKRSDPELRGSIENLGEDNFTPAHFARGLLEGMAEEMYGLYSNMRMHLGNANKLVASGNAVRRNEALRSILSERFDMELSMPETMEEAASGAARFAGMAWNRRTGE